MKVIGTRHAEKLYETLATTEELQSAIDEGDYWRLQMDGRGLNYEQYFTEGQPTAERPDEDYHSHNTRRLTVDETADLLLELPEIRADLERWRALR